MHDATIKIHNKDFYDLYPSPNTIWVIKSRRMRWVGHVARMGDRRSACRVLVGRLEEMSPLRRPIHRWEYSITIYLLEVDGETWTGLIWLRTGTCDEQGLVYTVMKTCTL